ncbi:endonuclease domain-containing protein [Glaciibacter flavus]|uniref:endonuclease domain-containing protein n=1 Tax=Orlajensenia flava TaxID=2565934 RepID=UPI003AFF923E
MPTRKPLPAPMLTAPFRTALVDGTAHGIGRGRLRGPDVEHPFHGVNVARGHLQTIDGLCDAYLLRMLPGQYFSHETAAHLFGVPLADDVRIDPVHVTVLTPRTPPRARGVIGHAIGAETFAVGTLRDKPVCSPADCWCQLAETLSFEDLVAAGDYLISGQVTDAGREVPLCTFEMLSVAANRYARRKGAHLRRRALKAIRFGVDSRPETHLRLLLIASGLAEPLIGHGVRVQNGRILHPDLVFEEFKIAFEYEGDGHRTDARQWRLDILRRQLLEAEGWHVIRVTSRDLYVDPEGFIQRVRDILARRAHLAL